jgi:hypothetical protein
MHSIEINGQHIEYRNVPDLNRKLGKRLGELVQAEATHKKALLAARDERRLIAKALGVPARPPEPRAVSAAA